jgi:hypothetical protein
MSSKTACGHVLSLAGVRSLLQTIATNCLTRKSGRSKLDGQVRLLERTAVKLTLLGTESVHGDCPTLYATDRDTYVVQGLRVTDPDALGAMQIPGHETAVEIPAGLLRFASTAEHSSA